MNFHYLKRFGHFLATHTEMMLQWFLVAFKLIYELMFVFPFAASPFMPRHVHIAEALSSWIDSSSLVIFSCFLTWLTDRVTYTCFQNHIETKIWLRWFPRNMSNIFLMSNITTCSYIKIGKIQSRPMMFSTVVSVVFSFNFILHVIHRVHDSDIKKPI